MILATAHSDDDMQTLAALADVIIPPSSAYGVPGAGDPDICPNIAAGSRSAERLQRALAELNMLADAAHGRPFTELSDSQRGAVAAQYRIECASSAGLMEALTMQAYYRDPRVMASLEMDPRPPFPEGYTPPQGDWSLLDPVRRRAPLFRKAD